ncbi:MAG: oligosaccharide flippase family protein, partial [Bacteroidetes bacterium]|nr:oligosaccharide flippase family protein [Bacteroidota bacterium]
MKKSFLFNVFFLVFVNFLIKPFWIFGIDRTVQNQLGESEYGLYFAIFNFTYLFQILLDFGFQNYNNREVAADTKRIQQLLPGILLIKTFLFLIYLVVCIAIAFPLGYLSKPFIFVILANQILLSFNIYLRSNISAHQHFITDALLSVLDKLLMIVFCLCLIYGNISGLQLSIFTFVSAQLLAYCITFIVCLFFSLRLIEKFSFTFSFQEIQQIARETMPYAIIHFLMTTYYRIDGVMLEKLQGTNGALESGIYAQGYRIMEALNNIGYLFAGILLPLFAYHLSKKKEIKVLLKSALSIMFCISVSIIACFYWYKKELMELLYVGSDIQYSAEVFGFLLLNFFPVAMLYVIGTLLTANQNFRLMIYTLIVAVIINVSLNFYLITNYGAKGAGIATLITQLFMLVCYSIYCLKIFKIKWEKFYAVQLFGFLVLCTLLMFILSKFTFMTNHQLDLFVHIILYFILIP